MRGCIHFFSVFFVLLIHAFSVEADPVDKKNLGFEKGTFSGWKGYTWIYRTDDTSLSTSKVEGIVSGRQTIMSDQSAYDSNTGSKLKIIPDGYKYSAKLGSTVKGGRHQSLTYTLKVDSTNALLVWKFAVVLLNPLSNHEKSEEPRFKITLFDENGDTISDCSNYDVYASDASINGFQEYYPSGSNEPVVWRDWTTVGANLLPYSGKNVTIEFMSADCTHKGHYGYGYFVLDCMPLAITVDYCTNDSEATLSAPSGFSAYYWKDENGVIVDSVQNLILPDPQEGETYECDMTSETGCDISLSAEVARYEQEADFSSEMLDCFSNKVQFTNLSTYSKGTLKYLWDFGDGNTSEEKDPAYTFETSGMHQVQLILYNPPSGCTDTLSRQVESFSPPLVGFSGDTTYCPGLETELTAYGAYSYEWSTGSTSETISFGAPGGDYWMIGYSTPEEGCVSEKKYFSISEEPDWSFTLDGDSLLCDGDTIILTANGAVSYLWNTDATSNLIDVWESGNYQVSGENARGCVKELDLDVTKVEKPNLDFSLNPTLINRRNNSVECSAQSAGEVEFEWDMGDGTINYSQQFIHFYSVGSDLISFPVKIKATNDIGCFTVKSSVVDVEPFVPNVFTPNNDGTNDLFMPGYQLKVFDRHGIVFFTGTTGWDGYYNGRTADPDTYFYQLSYTDVHDQEHNKTGFITLVR